MRVISFMLTERQIMERTKTQTRRLGWHSVKVGDRLRGVRKSQGRTRKCPECDGAGFVWAKARWRSDGDERLEQERCPTCDGRKKVTDPLVTLAIVEVTEVRRERLDAITPADVLAEGFPQWTNAPGEFVDMFCKGMKCTPETEVTVITFRYVDEEVTP